MDRARGLPSAVVPRSDAAEAHAGPRAASARADWLRRQCRAAPPSTGLLLAVRPHAQPSGACDLGRIGRGVRLDARRGAGSAEGRCCHPDPARCGTREATEDSLGRGATYLPRLCAILGEHGLPPDLALLPVVESGFWPTARGRAGERGLWQLRRDTARRFGLVVNARRDDRLHPERATRAAARYLVFLHARYGDWPLALAAYNAGERRVDRALRRGRRAGFWQLADRRLLPRTSRNYVPHFLALVRIAELRPSSQSACGEIAMKLPVAARVPPAPLSRPAVQARRVSFATRKISTPEGQTAEAGVAYPLSDRIAVQLSYERDAFGRAMPRDPENGVVATMTLGF